MRWAAYLQNRYSTSDHVREHALQNTQRSAMIPIRNNPANVIKRAEKEMAMGRGIGSLMAIAALAGALAFNSGAGAQTAAAAAENATPTPDNAVMLTIFLKHDQSRPLSELNVQLEKQGY